MKWIRLPFRVRSCCFHVFLQLLFPQKKHVKVLILAMNPLTSPLQVQTRGNWNHPSDPQHTPVLTHFLTGVNQPLSVPPLSHCGALGCWEGEDGTWDFRRATMTAGISEKPQPVLLWVCASVQSAEGWMLSSRQKNITKNETNAQCKKNILKRNSYFLQFKCTFDSVLYLGKQHFHSIKKGIFLSK